MAIVHIIVALVQIILSVIAEALTASLSLVFLVFVGAAILVGLIIAGLSGAGTLAVLHRRKTRHPDEP